MLNIWTCCACISQNPIFEEVSYGVGVAILKSPTGYGNLSKVIRPEFRFGLGSPLEFT